MLSHITNDASGVAGDNGKGRHIARHHSPGRHQRALTDFDWKVAALLPIEARR